VNRSLLYEQIALWGRDLVALVRQVSLLFSLVKHPLAPWPAKVVAGCGVCYVFSPIQLIPTIIPIVGQLDDLFVLYLTTRLVRKLTPAAVLEECELRAQVALCLQQTTWASIRGAAQKLRFARSHAIKEIAKRPDEFCPTTELDVAVPFIRVPLHRSHRSGARQRLLVGCRGVDAACCAIGSIWNLLKPFVKKDFGEVPNR
jgi:uncharacterized membrane protein YkvA (DUF1232 family)